MSRLALHTPAGQLLAEGCRRLRLPDAAALELLRFLSVKRLHDSLPAARRPRSMSPGTAVDALWHWMLLNTRVSAAVHELLGGVVEHVGTDEEDLDDDAKMMQRLYSMGLMAAEGWTPDERLWTERGTLMEAVAAVSSADGITLYATPHTSAAQRQQLAEDLQVVHVGVMRENGWARPAAAQPGSAAAAEAGPDAAMEVEAADGGSEAADEGAEQLFLEVLLPSRKQAVHRGLSVRLPAGATAADVKQALRDSDDDAVAAAAAQRNCLYCCGVGQLQDGDVLGQHGISSGHVLRLLQRPPRFPAGASRLWLQPAHAAAVAAGAGRIALDGRVAAWMTVPELQQLVQAVEGTPVAEQALSHGRRGRLCLYSTLEQNQVALDGSDAITLRRTGDVRLKVLLPGEGQRCEPFVLVSDANVAALKQLLAARTGTPLEQQRLVAWHLPEPLADGAALADVVGRFCSLLRLLLPGQARPHAAGPYLVYVKTLSCKCIPIAGLALEATVAELKQAVAMCEGIPIDEQRIIYNGKKLEDHRTLGHYKIEHETEVTLVLRLRGC